MIDIGVPIFTATLMLLRVLLLKIFINDIYDDIRPQNSAVKNNILQF